MIFVDMLEQSVMGGMTGYERSFDIEGVGAGRRRVGGGEGGGVEVVGGGGGVGCSRGVWRWGLGVLGGVLRVGVGGVLRRFRGAGLAAVGGGGGEIFAERVRKRIGPGKCSGEAWLDVMSEAHK